MTSRRQVTPVLRHHPLGAISFYANRIDSSRSLSFRVPLTPCEHVQVHPFKAHQGLHLPFFDCARLIVQFPQLRLSLLLPSAAARRRTSLRTKTQYDRLLLRDRYIRRIERVLITCYCSGVSRFAFMFF